VQDIIMFICKWQPTHDTLLCIDANNTTICSDDHGLDCIIESMNLIDLHCYHFPSLPSPATHHRGSKHIDYCLGLPGFAEALTGAWMLPFGLPATLTGNHQTMGLEFEHNTLFGQKVPGSNTNHKCGVYSNAYTTVCQFNYNMANKCDRQGLFDVAQTHSLKYTLSPADHQELECINKVLMDILITTDRHYAKHHNSPWSPELYQVFLEHCYWRTKLTQVQTHRDYDYILKNIAHQLKKAPAQQGSITQNLHHTQHQLHEIK